MKRHSAFRSTQVSLYLALIFVGVFIGCGGGTSGSGLNAYEGRVQTEDGKALEGVSITVEQTGDSTTSDKNGDFLILSDASGDEVAILAETSSFSHRVLVRNVLDEDSRIRVNITVDSILQSARTTDFNVRASIVGVCDYYFENRETIRQSNRVPPGTVCTAKVQVLAEGRLLDGAQVALQYSSCKPNAPWTTIGVAATGAEGVSGIAKLSFEYESSEQFCRYRIVAPYNFGDAWPVYYPIDTYAEQQVTHGR